MIQRNVAPYYVVSNVATVFVKEGAFFRSQGGLEEEWGKNWVAVDATSIGDARRKGAAHFGIKLSPIYHGEV